MFESTQDEIRNTTQGKRASSKLNNAEKEMTTGWQFATQIDDDDEYDENNGDGTNNNGEMRRAQNVSQALLLANKEMIPNMKFDDYEHLVSVIL